LLLERGRNTLASSVLDLDPFSEPPSLWIINGLFDATHPR
jgi:hypothetical protein